MSSLSLAIWQFLFVIPILWLIIIDETKRNETKFCEILRNTAKYEKIWSNNDKERQNSQTISQIFTSVDPVRKTVQPWAYRKSGSLHYGLTTFR